MSDYSHTPALLQPSTLAKLGLVYAVVHLLVGVAGVAMAPGGTLLESIFALRESFAWAVLIGAVCALVLSIERFVYVLRTYVVPVLRQG